MWPGCSDVVTRELLARTGAPDGAAVQQVPGPAAQSLDERGGGVEGEADEVDDDVGREAGDPVGEGALAVLGHPVRGHLTHLLPRLVVGVAGPLTAADADHVVPGADQPRDQERADVPASTDDHDSHGARLCQVAAGDGCRTPRSPMDH
jgi:hypothetical protein